MSRITPSKCPGPNPDSSVLTPNTAPESAASEMSSYFTPKSSNSRRNLTLTPASQVKNKFAEIGPSDSIRKSPPTTVSWGKTISPDVNVSGSNFHATPITKGKYLPNEMDSNDFSESNDELPKYRRLSLTKYRMSQTPVTSSSSNKTSPVDMNSNKSGQGESLLSEVYINSPVFKTKSRPTNPKERIPGTSKTMLTSLQALTSMTPKPVATILDRTTLCSTLEEVDDKCLSRISQEKIDNVMQKMQSDILVVRDLSWHGLVHWNGISLNWTTLGEVDDVIEDKERDGGAISGSDVEWDYGIGKRTRAATWKMTPNTSFENIQSGDVYDFDGFGDVVKREKPLTHSKNYNYIDADDTDDEFELIKPSKKRKKKPTAKTNVVELKGPVKKGKGKGKKTPTDEKNELFDEVRDGDGDDWLGKNNAGKSGKWRGGGKMGRGRPRKNGGVKKDETKAAAVDTIDNYFEKDINIENVVGNYSSDENTATIVSEGPSGKDVQTSGNMSPTEAICNKMWAKDKPSNSRYKVVGICPMCSTEMEMEELRFHASDCQG